MYKTTNTIQLPKNNKEIKRNNGYNYQYSSNTLEFKVQPGLMTFDPNTLSSTPPNSFLMDLEKRMSVYYVNK